MNFAPNTVEAVYTLSLATLTLWQPGASGNPFGSVIYTANCVNQITIRDSFVEKLTRPSGVAYKNSHVVDQDNFVTVAGLVDYTLPLERNTFFVMYIEWLQADKGVTNSNPLWRDRTYFGVNQMNRAIQGADEIGFHLVQNVQFRTQFYVENTGQGAPPGPAGYEGSST